MLLLKGPIFQTAEGGVIFRRPKFLSAGRGIKRAVILKCRFEDVLIFRKVNVSKCRRGFVLIFLEGPMFQCAEWNVFIFLEEAIFFKVPSGGGSCILEMPLFQSAEQDFLIFYKGHFSI